MKFQCQIFRDEIPQEDSLLKALRQISQRGAKWSLPSQPYDALTLILQNNQLTLRCGDARTTVEVALPCVTGLKDEQSREAQTITVPATLLDYWLALNKQCRAIEFELVDSYPNGMQLANLRISSGEGIVHLPLRQNAVASPMCAPAVAQMLVLPTNQLAQALELTRQMVNAESNSYNTSCLLLDLPRQSSQLHVVATDGRQLVWLQRPWLESSHPLRMLIPHALLTPHGQSLLDNLLDADESVELVMEGKWLRLQTRLLTIWHHNMELVWSTNLPEYVNYEAVERRVRESQPLCTIEVSSELLRQTLEQVQGFASKGNPIPIYLQPETDSLSVKTSAIETLTSLRVIPARVTGVTAPINVNPEYLLHFCQLWRTEKLQLIVYSNKLPLEVRPTRSNGRGLFCCVMPMNGDLDW